MPDRGYDELLSWALPRLGLRWQGFRRVRGQVRKRIARRMKELGLGDVAAYGRLLESDPTEWARFDGFCRISISRFYRDRAVFDRLRDDVLPGLCGAARGRGAPGLRCWSAGCASGEEPYTLAILFELSVGPRFPGLGLKLLATDADEGLLRRADRACYERATLRELPEAWISRAFTSEGGALCLRPELRARVALRRQDLRREMPDGPFDLVLCRNLAFTYFEVPLQQGVLARILDRLVPGGALVIGGHESLPPGDFPLEQVEHLPIFRRGR